MISGATLEPGAQLGRFNILRLLGVGGMGAVYEAHDPDLDRRVAVKLLKTSEAGDGGVRLVREAQALAQLAHANVVAVHEVDTDGDQVYVVMELVDGATLGEHLAARRRDWREILALFVQAGRGLEAAHARGIVHRDFKPANVLVDRQGRVRVTDFGLARVERAAFEEGVAPAPPSGDDTSTIETGGDAVAVRSPAGRLLDAPLTAAGTVIGTPRYMAPEQRARGAVTVKSDQYSFCVALWEALHGVMPPARARRVPRWLSRALATGLAVRPADRHPSMIALLDVLERTPVRRRRFATVAAGLFLAGSSAAAALVIRPGAASCDPAAARAHVATVWDDAARAGVRASFVGAARPGAAEVFARVDRALTATTTAWADASTAACRATERGEQSQALLDLRMACLERTRRRVAALVDAWRREAPRLDSAVAAAGTAADLAACADGEALTALVPLPGDPAARRAVEALRAELDEVDALRLAARLDAALARAPALVERARAAGHAPTLAEALWLHADLEEDAGRLDSATRLVQDAMRAAAEGRDDRRVAHALRSLIFWTGIAGQRLEAARALFAPAEAAVARAGGDERLRADLLQTESAVLQQHGEHAEAARLAAEALATFERVHSDDPERDRARFELSLANAKVGLGEWKEAEALYERALAGFERTAGPEHPDTTKAMRQLASLLSRRGDDARAEALARRVVEIRERLFGPEHPDVADALTTVAAVILRAGDREAEALLLLERALAIREKAFGPQHGLVAQTLGNLAKVQTQLKAYDAARALFARSLAITEAVHGPNHPQLAGQLVGLAFAQKRTNDTAGARASFERAVAIYRRGSAVEPDHIVALRQLGILANNDGRRAEAVPYFIEAIAVHEKLHGAGHAGQIELHANLGQTYREAGQLAEARASLERAVEVADRVEGDRFNEANAREQLALVLWAQGERPRAVELMRAAREGWVAVPDVEQVAVVDRWLHGRR